MAEEKNEMFSNNEKIIDESAEYKQSQLEEIKNRRDAKRRRKRNQKIALIVLLILICGGAILGAFYLSDKSDNLASGDPIVQGEATQTPEASPTVSPTVAPTLAPSPTPEATVEPEQTEAAATQKPSTNKTSDTADSVSSNKTQSTNSANTSKNTQSSSNKTQSTSKATPAPAKSKELSGVLTRAEAAVKDVATGNVYSKIVVNNKEAYLKVSDEPQPTGYVMVTATPSDEKYNNAPVYIPNNITSVGDSEFLIPESSTKVLTAADLSGFSKEQLALARNEIYARHGRRFKNGTYQKYFEGKSWYKENPDYKYNNDELNISELENKNAHFILDYERNR